MVSKPKILYVSYDGILEPLGYSQVYKYIIKQAKYFDLDLISFEKNEDSHRSSSYKDILNSLRLSNITWHSRKYHQSKGAISSLINLFSLIYIVLKSCTSKKYDVIHARSYLPAIPFLILRPLIKSKFVFDIRGFWIDEKHDRLNWKKNSFKFIALKYLERKLFKIADCIVTLTEESIPIIACKFNIPQDRIVCIRTCVDLQEFNKTKDNKSREINLGYLGSIDTAYDFDLFLDLIKFFHSNFQNAFRVSILTKQVEFATNKIQSLEFDFPYKIEFKSGNALVDSISDFDFLAFFLKKNESLKASMPTKIAESLALGVPIICNGFNKDIYKIIENHKCGLIIENKDNMDDELVFLIKRMLISSQKENCKLAAKMYFDLNNAVKKYSEIYLS